MRLLKSKPRIICIYTSALKYWTFFFFFLCWYHVFLVCKTVQVREDVSNIFPSQLSVAVQEMKVHRKSG